MCGLYFSSVMGLSPFKAHIDSNHALMSCLGTEVMVPIEITVPSAHLALARKVSDSHDRTYDRGSRI